MNVSRRSVFRLVVGGFILFLMIYFYTYAGERVYSAMVPVIIGLLFAYPMGILIGFFERHDFLYNRKIIKSDKLHTALCVALAIILLLLALLFIFLYMGPQLTACVIALLDKVPSGIRFLLAQPAVASLIPKETMDTLAEVDWNDWINHLVSIINGDDLFRSMTSTASSALSAVTTLGFSILYCCYILSGRDKVRQVLRRFVRAYLPEENQEFALHTFRLLNTCFRDFIVCQVMQAVIIGVSATILMMIFRFPYATMIGTLNGFCALLPVIGGYIGAILGTLMIMADAPQMALFFLIFIVVLQNVIGTLIFPRIVGRNLGLPGAWTLGAVMLGNSLKGILGILLCVPLTAFVYHLAGELLARKEAEKSIAPPENAEVPDISPEPPISETEKTEKTSPEAPPAAEIVRQRRRVR